MPILTQGEGVVFGIGIKIFTIAGPMILYGVFASWVVGVVYWVLKVMLVEVTGTVFFPDFWNGSLRISSNVKSLIGVTLI